MCADDEGIECLPIHLCFGLSPYPCTGLPLRVRAMRTKCYLVENQVTGRVGLKKAAEVLTIGSSILSHRIVSATPPPGMPEEWVHYLKAMEIESLRKCERIGLASFVRQNAPEDMPEDLLRLVRLAGDVYEMFPKADWEIQAAERVRVKERKLKQIEYVAKVCSEVIEEDEDCVISRIVDVGAGHGHLSQKLADDLEGTVKEIVGLERSARLLNTAKSLYRSGSNVSRVCSDAVLSSIVTGPGDLLVGLHACGSLGDTIIDAAASQGSSGVVLVTCCLQKRDLNDPNGSLYRKPLSRYGLEEKDISSVLTVEKSFLGVTNRSRGYGSEAILQGRLVRHGLRKLLALKGFEDEFAQRTGSEVHGISRHKIKRGLMTVAKEALKLRGFTQDVTEKEIKKIEKQAEKEYRVMRALTLPRSMLGEVLEMAIVLDRATRLEESGAFRRVARLRLFPDEVSPRNLCIVGIPKKKRMAG